MSHGAVVHADRWDRLDLEAEAAARSRRRFDAACDWCLREFPELDDGQGGPHPAVLVSALLLRSLHGDPVVFRRAVERRVERVTGPGGFWEGTVGLEAAA